MNLLAIETSTEACSAALAQGQELIERREIAPRRHAELILPMIESLLAEAGLSRRQLDAIAVGRGPGAFTGVRLGISVAQGLALGLDLPVVPVSSLAALALDAAMQAPASIDAILAVIDARMGEVYAAAFRPVEEGQLQALGAESVGSVAELDLPPADRWAVVGTGWGSYREALLARLSSAPVFAESERYPQAGAIARLAMPQLASGQGVAPELALPVYLRDKVALTLEEQRRH